MILRPRPHGLMLFFALTGSIVPRILAPLSVTVGLAILVTMLHGAVLSHKITLTPIPFTLMGLALSIFLGFRNSASYERFWEGRKLWGELIIDCRSLARLLVSHAEADEAWRSRNLRRLIAFAYALAHHLRDTDGSRDIAAFLEPDEAEQVLATHNRPDSLLRRASAELAAAARAGRIEPMMVTGMERLVQSLCGVQAGCERIKNTPLPFSYTLLLHRTAYLYCFALPFGLVDSIGFTTPFVVAIVAYTFFGLDALGDEIEEPFGLAPHDLPLTALCRTVERDLLAALGSCDLPPAAVARDFLLL